MATLLMQPGAMDAQDAKAYVGGRAVFEALQEEYPNVAKPIYKTSRAAIYTKASLDRLLSLAEEGKTLTNLNQSH